MHRLTIFAVAAIVAGAPAAVAAAKPKGFTVHATQTSLRQPTASSIQFTETLRSGKRTVGHDRVTCKAATGDVQHCTGTITITGQGTITVSGEVGNSGGDSTLRITRGTGAYAGAKGRMRLHPTGAKTDTLTFTFS